MGFALIKKNSPKNGYDSHAIVEIMIDTKEDLQNLPVGFDAGSIAYTADRSVTATLNTKGEWIEHVGENGGGSGGGMFVIEIVVDSDANVATVNKTFAEIDAAYRAGLLPVVYDPKNGIFLHMNEIPGGNQRFAFGRIYNVASDINSDVVNIYADNTVCVYIFRLESSMQFYIEPSSGGTVS